MTNKPNLSDEAMERQAREHLAAHRWRKARDELKILCKKDRAKFQPLLIEANVGLAREMMEKGMVSEAQQVVAYLKTIAPAAIIKSLELQVANRSGDKEKSFSGALGLLTTSRDGLPEEERLRLADQLVLAFAPIPSQTPEEAALAAEAQAIQEAIQAISDGQVERAQDIIRPLARDSVFSHWKLWVKGLAHSTAERTRRRPALSKKSRWNPFREEHGQPICYCWTKCRRPLRRQRR